MNDVGGTGTFYAREDGEEVLLRWMPGKNLVEKLVWFSRKF